MKLRTLLLCALIALCVMLTAGVALADGGCYTLTAAMQSGRTWKTAAYAVDQHTLLTLPLPGESEGITVQSGDTGALTITGRELKGGLLVLTVEDELTAWFSVGESSEGTFGTWRCMDGRFVSDAATITGTTVWQNQQAFTVSATAISAGDAVLDAAGRLQAIVVTRWLEGDTAALALPVTGAVPLSQAWLDSFNVTVDGCVITMTSGITEADPDDHYRLTVMDIQNNYTDSFTLNDITKPATFGGVPGHSYVVWLQRWRDTPMPLDWDAPSRMAVMPVGDPYTANAYQETECYFGYVDQSDLSDMDKLAEPAEALTADLLGGETVPVVQVVSTYEVTEQVDMPMICALLSPSGNIYTEESHFYLLPDIMTRDAWRMDLTRMLTDASAMESGLQAGTYELSWYFNDQPAGQISFEIR